MKGGKDLWVRCTGCNRKSFRWWAPAAVKLEYQCRGCKAIDQVIIAEFEIYITNTHKGRFSYAERPRI